MTARFTIALVALLLLATGCAVHPSPGLSAVTITVTAIPKPGAEKFANGDTSPSDYDPTPSQSPAALEHLDYSNLSDIIVWLTPLSPTSTAPPAPLKLELSLSSAEVEPIAVGQQLLLENNGTDPIAAYSVSDGNEFNLPPLAPGGTETQLIRAEGLLEILTDPTRLPSAALFVVPTNFYATAHSNETVTFNNLPPGQYTAHTWHPRLPGTTATLTLTPNQITHTNLTVSVNNLRTN